MDAAANRARLMSATLLIFYAIPVAVLYSATQVERVDDSRRCLNGHRVPGLAKFCEECGSPCRTAERANRRFLKTGDFHVGQSGDRRDVPHLFGPGFPFALLCSSEMGNVTAVPAFLFRSSCWGCVAPCGA